MAVTGNLIAGSLSLLNTNAFITGGAAGNDYLQIATPSSGLSGLTLKNLTGFIGVNNLNPSYNLDVGGSGRFSGSIISTQGGIGIIAGGATATAATCFAAQSDGVSAGNSFGSQAIIFMNGTARTADGGTLCATFRNDAGGDLRIVTADTTGLFIKRFTGFVGVGSNLNNPAYQLDVGGNFHSSGTVLCDLNLNVGNGNGNLPYAMGQALLSNGTNSISLVPGFSTAANGTVAIIEAFNIGNTVKRAIAINCFGGGNVGIGTYGPQYTLDVAGSGRIATNLFAGTVAVGSLASTLAALTTLTANSISSTIGSLSTLTASSLSSTLGFLSTLTAGSLSSTVGSLSTLTTGSISSTIGSLSTLTASSLSSTLGSLSTLTTGSISSTIGSLSTLTASSLSSTLGSLSTLTTGSISSTVGSLSTLTTGSISSTIGSLSTLTSGSINTGVLLIGTYSASVSTSFIQSSNTGQASYGMDLYNAFGASMGINNSTGVLGFCVGSGYGNYQPSSTRMTLDQSGVLRVPSQIQTGTLIAGSLTGTFSSFTQAYASTLSASNFNPSTLTAGSLNSTYASIGTAFSSTIVVGTFSAIQSSSSSPLNLNGPLSILNGANDFSRFISALDNSQASGTSRYLVFGQSATSGNEAELGFTFYGNNNASNAFTLGLYGKVIVNMQNSGMVGIGNGVYNPSYTLDVNGTSRALQSIVGTGILSSLVGVPPNGLIMASTVSYSANGPHFNVYSNSTYPTFQQLNYAIDSTWQAFDSYWDYNGNWRSSGTITPYLFTKNSSTLQFLWATTGTATQPISWNPAITVNSAGLVGIGTASAAYTMDISGSFRYGLAGLGQRVHVQSGSYFSTNTYTQLGLLDTNTNSYNGGLIHIRGALSGWVTPCYVDVTFSSRVNFTAIPRVDGTVQMNGAGTVNLMVYQNASNQYAIYALCSGYVFYNFEISYSGPGIVSQLQSAGTIAPSGTQVFSLANTQMLNTGPNAIGIGTVQGQYPLDVSGTIRGSPDFGLTASSAAWNTSLTKGIYQRYSLNGSQDGAYIQSIDRTTNYMYSMNIQASTISFDTGSTGGLGYGRLVITPTGSVGIGYGSAGPTYTFDVNGNARLGNSLLSNSAGNMYLIHQSQAASATTNFALYQSALCDTVLNTAAGQQLEFKVGNAEYMRLSSGGLLGINNTNPSYPLDVFGNARIGGYNSFALGPRLLLHNTAGGGGAAGAIDIYTFPGGNNYDPAVRFAGLDSGNYGGILTLSTRASTGGSTSGNVLERMRITDAGFVGINTSSPAFPLHVYSSMTDNPAVNPDAFKSLILCEDYLQPALNSGSLTGNATYVYGTVAPYSYVQLNPATTVTSGSVYWNTNLGESWVMNAEIYAGGGTGADQISFFAYCSANNNGAGGYAFAWNEYGTNQTSSALLIYNNTLIASLSTSIYTIPQNQWNNVKVTFVRNTIRMYMNNTLLINYRDVPRNLTGQSFCGFQGFSGGSTNNHRVRNIRVSKYTDGVWSYSSMTSSDIVFYGGNVGIGTQTAQYPLDVNGISRFTGPVWANNQTTNQILCLFTNDATPSPNSVNYLGLGINNSTLRYQVPSGQNHTWFASNTQMMILNSSGLGLNVGSLSVIGTGGTTVAYFYNPGNASRVRIDGDYGQQSGISLSYGGADTSVIYRPSSSSDTRLYTASAGDLMTWTNSGRVGILNTIPSYPLDISGQARIVWNNAQGLIIRNQAANSSPCEVYFDETVVATTLSSAIGIAPGRGAYWFVGGNDRVNISTAGSVSINYQTAVSSYTLDVNGSFHVGSYTSVLSNGNNSGGTILSQLMFGWNQTGYRHAIQTRHDTSISSNNAVDIYLWNCGTDSQFTGPTKQVMSLCGSGAVGIGTLAPQYTLDVNGTGHFSSALTIDNGIISTPAVGSVARPSSGLYTYSDRSFGMEIQSWNANSSNGNSQPNPWATTLLTRATDGCFVFKKTNAPYQNTDNGTPFMVISNSGQVGIGTTSPGYALDVNGTVQYGLNDNASMGHVQMGFFKKSGYPASLAMASDTSMAFGKTSVSQFSGGVLSAPGAATWTEYMRLTNSGFLGIGTTSPQYPVDIVSTNPNPARFLGANPSQAGAVSIETWYPGIGFNVINNTFNNSGSSYAFYGGIIWQNTPSNGYIQIAPTTTTGTVGSSATYANGIYITPASQLGVNQPSPTYTLDVNGTGRFSSGLYCNSGIQNTANSGIYFSDGNKGIIYSGGNNNFYFATTTSRPIDGLAIFGWNDGLLGTKYGGSNSVALYWNYSNQVGINTTTPSYNLDVSGTARVSSYLWFNQQVATQTVCIFSNDGAPNSSSSNYYGFGMNPGTLRYNIPLGQTHAWYASNTSLMTLNQTGLGIFTSPSYALDVNGATRFQNCLVGIGSGLNQFLTLASSPSGTNTVLSFGTTSAAPGAGSLNIVSPVAGATYWIADAQVGDSVIRQQTGSIRLAAGNGSANANVVIAQNNLTGINQASPVYPLDVGGTCRVQQSLVGTGSINSLNPPPAYGLMLVSTISGNANGPHVHAYPGTTYPCFQQLNWALDNTSLNFDSYFDYNGTWRASGTPTPFQFYKTNGALKINWGTTGTASQSINWTTAFLVNSSGQVGINNSTPAYNLDVYGPQRVALYQGGLGPRMILHNTAGGAGSGGALDIYTFAAGTVSDPACRVMGLDTGNYGGILTFSTRPSNGQNVGTVTERMRITDAGNVGVNQTSPAYLLDVNGSGRFTGPLYLSTNAAAQLVVNGTSSVPASGANGSLQVSGNPGARAAISTYQNSTSVQNHIEFFTSQQSTSVGYISTSGASTAYNTSSDRRLKQNIQILRGASSVVRKLNPVSFKFKKSDDTEHQGFIADELQQCVPQAVTGEPNAYDDRGLPKYQGVDMAKIVPYLTSALQESMERIQSLESRLAELEAKR